MSKKRKANLILDEGKRSKVIAEYIWRNVGGKNLELLNGGHIEVPGLPKKVGVMVAVKIGKKKYGVGFSLTNTNAGDDFEPSLGMASAITRALGFQVSPNVPDSMAEEFASFTMRAKSYFKKSRIVNCPDY